VILPQRVAEALPLRAKIVPKKLTAPRPAQHFARHPDGSLATSYSVVRVVANPSA